MSLEDLQDLLESLPDMGKLAISRTGVCTGYRWRIEWKTSPGDHPLLQVCSDCINDDHKYRKEVKETLSITATATTITTTTSSKTTPSPGIIIIIIIIIIMFALYKYICITDRQ